MEVAKPEHVVVGEAPPKKRWWLQYSLRTLVLGVLGIGLVGFLAASLYETKCLRQENKVLRAQLGELTIEDPSKTPHLARWVVPPVQLENQNSKIKDRKSFDAH